MSDLLTIRDLHVRFAAPGGFIRAVRGVSFRVRPRSTVALVGESGSGKSVVSQAIMRILPRSGQITQGEILFTDPRGDGGAVDLDPIAGQRAEMRAIRGGRISIIFQEPMTSLSPVHTVGNQVGEALRLHRRVGAAEAVELTRETLRLVGFPDPRRALQKLSVRIVGRSAAARDDRDGAGLPPGAADRRRADDGARRDDPGANPEARARIAARTRHGGAADHPRSRRRRQCRRGDRRHVSRRGRGKRHAARTFSAVRSIPICAPCCARCRAST